MRRYNRERRDYRRQYCMSKRRWHYQSIRLDHDDAQMLKAIAKRRSTTVAELIRTYVAWGLENDYGGADAD
jgi:predicted DNA-binding ribbon-helix-helix protein